MKTYDRERTGVQNDLAPAEMKRKQEITNKQKRYAELRTQINFIGANIGKHYYIDRRFVPSNCNDMITVLTNKSNRCDQIRVRYNINDEEMPLIIQKLVQLKENGDNLEPELFVEDEIMLNVAKEYLILKGL